ncbi:NAD(+)--dinitrogen-reductase ADP-D-ribosyltransferase [Pseudomaricurvus sp. HS19]|uniref:NAD(+)--dinitrogen-reductase ADP-D-ribosyltransferase n=1 Tax=Pseudomaricurvus sp. HS19 TaxID=2692626 RepID=UPI00136A788E|nr:NAD(+)--dinitrogen-reductase ADP-D-ribosyltransferase [Pseudomaricurvus sp. HS19]MYM64896.1 NAD(+)--dinitrogen-reductase ADP-D-ribosyltransferase [Pseudomaricurvus sp. HS19]
MTQRNSGATEITHPVSLPLFARLSINRCNQPAVILGSRTFQQHPVPLCLDGVQELHSQLFRALEDIDEAEVRALHFRQYMSSAFLLGKSDEAGFDPANQGVRRDKADYLRLLRGWMFNADGVEAAVLKRWVESRFGLRALNHRGSLSDPNSETYERFEADFQRGLYNSNALESQLDLLYSYCQYELQRRWPDETHRTLYRGLNWLEDHYVIEQPSADECVLLLNNLNSFSCDRDHASAFGDVILEATIPLCKLIYFPGLLPGVLQGESEYLVLGGVCAASMSHY